MHETDATRVLELASGFGSNSAFLARRNPNVRFDAIDLSNDPLRGFSKIPNVRFHRGDYHDLSRFEDTAYDIAFNIEAFAYSQNKLRFLREVKKKLKTNGLLIIFDGYEANDTWEYSQSDDIMRELVGKSMAIDRWERLDDVEGYMRQEFSIVVSKDLSANVLPSWERLEDRVRFYFKHPIFARAVNKILPVVITKNLVASLLVAPTLRRKLSCYYLHVLRNDH
ncbi:MAG: class I SAM-dependent methyltransferase [Halobacteriota archaeon]